jgi:Uma2 family endonuclease
MLMLVEGADRRLDYDRDVKTSLDPRAGLSEAWIVDLKTLQVEGHRELDGDGGARRHDYAGAAVRGGRARDECLP